MASRLRSLAADTRPLKESAQFRRLFFGETISVLGTQMTAVALPVQMYALTKSSFNVGLLGLTALVPLIIFGLLGGSIADAVDRRKMALLTAGGLSATSLLLFLQAAGHWEQVWLLYLVSALQAGLFGMDSSARGTFAPRLVPPDQLAAVAALRQIGFNAGMSVGPLLAGVIIAGAGLKAAYLFDVISFAAAFYAVLRLPPMRPEGGGTKAGLRSVVEGFTYLGTQRIVLMTFLVDIVAMVFGMPRALFPALAVDHFHGGAQTAGLLYAAPAIGALLGAVFSGPLQRVRRQGLAVLVAIVGWGLAIAAFGLSSSLWLALFFLALAGMADMVSAVFRSAIMLNATPDEMRGRLSGVFLVVVAGGPRLGDMESGGMAAAVSPGFSVVSGGLICVGITVALGLWVRSFARYVVEPGTAQELSEAKEDGSTEIQVAEANAITELSGP